MKAFGLTQKPHSGDLIDTLQLLDLPEPHPKNHELLIQVYATSINIDDIRIAEGKVAGGVPIAPKPTLLLPVVPGMDVSGVIAKIGSKVTKFKIGDEVFGVCDARFRNGAWAEYCCANESQLLLKPKEWSFEEAAGVGVAAGVACFSVNAAKVKHGDRCIVIGASGGIGSLIVRLLCNRGAEVIGVCSTKNLKFVLDLGAKRVFDYTQENFAAVLSSEKSLPFDSVFDCIGGLNSEKDSLKIISKKGTFVTSVGPIYFNGDNKLGFLKILRFFTYVFSRMLLSRIRGPRYIIAGPTKKTYQKLVPELVQKKILPAIDHRIVFDIGSIKEAIKYITSHRAKGKVILSIKSSPPFVSSQTA